MTSQELDALKLILKNINWREDECGPYWVAEFYNADGKRIGITGSYYDVNRQNKRQPREVQEALMRYEFELIEAA